LLVVSSPKEVVDSTFRQNKAISGASKKNAVPRLWHPSGPLCAVPTATPKNRRSLAPLAERHSHTGLCSCWSEAVLRIDYGDGGNVDDILDFGAALQQMHRLGHSRQDRA